MDTDIFCTIKTRVPPASIFLFLFIVRARYLDILVAGIGFWSGFLQGEIQALKMDWKSKSSSINMSDFWIFQVLNSKFYSYENTPL